MSILQTNEKTTILKQNYDAIEYLSWFMTDTMNVQNTAGDIFRGGVDTTDASFLELLQAAKKRIAEVEDDITNIKLYLKNIEDTL